MNKKLGLVSFLKRQKINANGLLPIYLRITIGGVRTDISSEQLSHAAKWNKQSQKLTGYSEEVRSINSTLKAMEMKVYNAFEEIGR
jgi:hypothetical protein